jgi:hypothetical protein
MKAGDLVKIVNRGELSGLNGVVLRTFGNKSIVRIAPGRARVEHNEDLRLISPLEQLAEAADGSAA